MLSEFSLDCAASKNRHSLFTHTVFFFSRRLSASDLHENQREEKTLIENITPTAVMNILKTAIYELDISYASQHDFQK